MSHYTAHGEMSDTSTSAGANMGSGRGLTWLDILDTYRLFKFAVGLLRRLVFPAVIAAVVLGTLCAKEPRRPYLATLDCLAAAKVPAESLRERALAVCHWVRNIQLEDLDQLRHNLFDREAWIATGLASFAVEPLKANEADLLLAFALAATPIVVIGAWRRRRKSHY